VSISATEGVTSPTFSTGMPSTTAAQEDKQMFLELMVAQLRYQDPLNPSDSGEFLAQSAQFTALEKMQDVADRVGAMLGAQMAFGAGAMVGQHVSWINEDGETLTGTIDGVTFGAQGPIFDIGGTEVPLANIVSVTHSPAGPSDSPSDSPTDSPTDGSPADDTASS
jgi:flagellar basal-body rod modification protein FlgD